MKTCGPDEGCDTGKTVSCMGYRCGGLWRWAHLDAERLPQGKLDAEESWRSGPRYLSGPALKAPPLATCRNTLLLKSSKGHSN